MSRVFYPDSVVEVEAWGDNDAFLCNDAEVWIEGTMMLISYFDEDGIVVLEGQRDGALGWILAARSRARRATLEASSEDDRCLSGTFDEQGETGRWRLRLGDPQRDDSAKG